MLPSKNKYGLTQKVTSSHWGAFYVEADGQKIHATRPFEEDSEVSDIFRIVPQAVHHRTRIARPAIRKDWLNGKRGNRRDTGRGAFADVPWDEALDIAAQEIDRVRKTFGNGAIFGGSYGWASAGRFHHAQSQLKRFLNCAGGFVSARGSYSAGASYVIIPHIFGVSHWEFTWEWQNPWPDIAQNTETLVAFGGINPKNAQVNSGGVGNHQTGAHLTQLIANGAEIHTISPLASDGPDGGTWVSVTPGTDVALMLGLAFVLETEGLTDRAFLARCTEGYPNLQRYILGLDGSDPKTPEWAAEICGVSTDVIRGLARRMAQTRTFITVAWALQRARHGEQTYWMAAALAAMLGQIGLPGGGVGFGYGAVAGVGTNIKALPGLTFPQGTNPVDDFIPVARIADMLLNPGGGYQYNGEDRQYPDIRLIYWAGGNPFHHHQDLNRLMRAWDRPDTIIVNEPWWTPTAQRADIVFPATTAFEREDIGWDRSDPFLFHMPQIIAPVGDARNDHDIFCGLAERLGLEEDFTQGRGPDIWLTHLYDRFRETCQDMSVAVPDLDTLREINWVKLDLENTRAPSPLTRFRENPDAYPLGTPSGRMELYSNTVAGFAYDGLKGHPAWYPNDRDRGQGLAQPLHLVSPQPGEKLHSQLEAALADVKDARPVRMLIHPDASEARQVRDGDIVQLVNARGRCLARAFFCEEIHKDVVALPTGAWMDLDSDGCETQGNPNMLTEDVGTSPLAQGSTAHTALVDCLPFTPAPSDQS